MEELFMMTDQELESLLKDIESDRAERKSSASDGDKIREAVCAFANDLPNHQKPGVIFIGVKNDGSCTGLEITDELLLKLSSMRSDGNILPVPSMIVQKRTLCGNEMAVIIVERSNDPPVRYKGVTWIRVGPRRDRATREEEQRLAEKRRSRDLPYDLQPITSASLDDLDLELFRRVYLPSAISPEVLEENNRSIDQQLTALRFTASDLPGNPTVTGLLTVGKTPSDIVSGAYVQFLRLDGVDLSDPIKNHHALHGPLLDILPRLDDLLEINISTSLDITASPVEIRQPDYPIVAIQQLVRNAIMHRDYETSNAPVRVTWFNNRIEIQNPGGPFGQVTREKFGTPGLTDYRNPHVAEVMKNLGYVQQFGMGIPLARKELAKNGNPEPEFLVEANHVQVVIRSRS
jgi:ATP-dependent DNA helicase RecG